MVVVCLVCSFDSWPWIGCVVSWLFIALLLWRFAAEVVLYVVAFLAFVG